MEGYLVLWMMSNVGRSGYTRYGYRIYTGPGAYGNTRLYPTLNEAIAQAEHERAVLPQYIWFVVDRVEYESYWHKVIIDQERRYQL